MSASLRLYPQAWRERYGDELVALLEERPASLLDHLDLIRGALDARLHPQVRGSGATPGKESSVNQRILAIMAAAGGVVWAAGLAAWLTSPMTADGGHDTSVVVPAIAVAITLMGIAVGELGTRPGNDGSRLVGHAIAATSVVFSALILPSVWPLIIPPIFGFPVLAALAAFRGVRNGVMPTWLAIVISVGAIAAWMGFGGTTPDGAKWVGVLFGATFVLLAAQTLIAPRRPAERAVA